MGRRAKVSVSQAGPNSWLVSTGAIKPRYRKFWPTEIEANNDADRIRRQLAGTGLDAALLREYEAAAHRLAITEGPCRGKSITWVVDWVLANYRGESSNKTLAEWASVYYAQKALVIEDKSLREIQQYLCDHFVAEFGHMMPAQISHEQLEDYLAANPSRWHRDKVLRAFFRWLAGEESRKMATLPNAPLAISPFAYIVKLPFERASEEVAILTVAEVRAAIELAIKKHPLALGQLVFLIFTGLRPDCEAPPFWKSEKHRWRRIDFRRRLLSVTKDLEKTGARNRQLVLQPNVIKWLEYFQKNNTPMVCPRRAWRAFKAEAYPDRAHVQDLARHTSISNYAHRLTVMELEHQFATSQDMIFKHYLTAIAEEAEVDEFFSLTPESFGLS
jgi:integrase